MFVGTPQIARSTLFLSRTRSWHLVQSSGVKERGAFKLEIVFDPVQVDAGLVCAAQCMLTGM